MHTDLYLNKVLINNVFFGTISSFGRVANFKSVVLNFDSYNAHPMLNIFVTYC